MKSQRNGRTAVTVTISLQPSELKFVKSQVQALKPRVSSRSNYFQQFVQMDKEKRLLR